MAQVGHTPICHHGDVTVAPGKFGAVVDRRTLGPAHGKGLLGDTYTPTAHTYPEGVRPCINKALTLPGRYNIAPYYLYLGVLLFYVFNHVNLEDAVPLGGVYYHHVHPGLHQFLDRKSTRLNSSH